MKKIYSKYNVLLEALYSNVKYFEPQHCYLGILNFTLPLESENSFCTLKTPLIIAMCGCVHLVHRE